MTNLQAGHHQQADPFLKWAGGKRWFADNFLGYVPEFDGTYIEPFLGSGAVFFGLAPKKAVLSDLNSDLINAYAEVRDNPEVIDRYLLKYQKEHSENFYYEMRASNPQNLTKKAARFIYLNRTCWNGLYRVNLKGEFNVPIGTKNEVAFPEESLKVISSRLKGVQISCSDFESIIDEARAGDLVFADPPYTVNHNLNGFVKYNEKLFSWDDQQRLQASAIRADARGVTVVITNADHASIRELYRNTNFHFKSLPRHSKLSGIADGRKPITELLIRSM